MAAAAASEVASAGGSISPTPSCASSGATSPLSHRRVGLGPSGHVAPAEIGERPALRTPRSSIASGGRSGFTLPARQGPTGHDHPLHLDRPARTRSLPGHSASGPRPRRAAARSHRHPDPGARLPTSRDIGRGLVALGHSDACSRCDGVGNRPLACVPSGRPADERRARRRALGPIATGATPEAGASAVRVQRRAPRANARIGRIGRCRHARGPAPCGSPTIRRRSRRARHRASRHVVEEHLVEVMRSEHQANGRTVMPAVSIGTHEHGDAVVSDSVADPTARMHQSAMPA